MHAARDFRFTKPLKKAILPFMITWNPGNVGSNDSFDRLPLAASTSFVAQAVKGLATSPLGIWQMSEQYRC
jgi:hypothetical protein